MMRDLIQYFRREVCQNEKQSQSWRRITVKQKMKAHSLLNVEFDRESE